MTVNQSCRHAYRDHLVELLKADPTAICLDTDTGLFTGVDFGPAADRYLNLGIAEHNLMGVAAGLALSGMTPYVNTMATFAATRAVEAVKIDVAYNNVPVRIVATHSGVSAGHLGPTHHALEDLAVMRALPNMTVVVPGDAPATIGLLDQLSTAPGPVYLRLGRKETPLLPACAADPVVGRLQVLRSGADVVIVCVGPLPVLGALEAADLLRNVGIDAAVAQAHTIKPFDTGTLAELAATCGLVVTVEEHWRIGGLGSAVAEALTESVPRRLLRIGMPDAFVATVGGQRELLADAGVSAPMIAEAVLRELPSRTRARVTG